MFFTSIAPTTHPMVNKSPSFECFCGTLLYNVPSASPRTPGNITSAWMMPCSGRSSAPWASPARPGSPNWPPCSAGLQVFSFVCLHIRLSNHFPRRGSGAGRLLGQAPAPSKDCLLLNAEPLVNRSDTSSYSFYFSSSSCCS